MPFPSQEPLITDLVHDHVAIEDEPLLVAIYFDSEIAPREECLFEVARNFGLNEVGEDSHIFQIQFGRTPNFDLPEGDRLRLFLTNPVEFRQALRDHWPEVLDLQQAISRNEARVLFHRKGDPDADEVLAALGSLQAVAA
jgi:hypothetical protein